MRRGQEHPGTSMCETREKGSKQEAAVVKAARRRLRQNPRLRPQGEDRVAGSGGGDLTFILPGDPCPPWVLLK